MNAIESLTGESTTTGSVGAAVVGAPTVIVPPAAMDTKKKKKIRISPKPIKEGEEIHSDQPVIPTDAKAIGTDKDKIVNAPGGEKLIPTSVALVAPDTTPDGESPLDPTQVPQPLSTTNTKPVIQQAQPAAEKPNSVLDLFQIHNKASQESLKIATDPGQAISVEALVENGPDSLRPTTATVTEAKSKAEKIVNQAMSGSMPAPDVRSANELMGKTVAAYRQIFEK